MRVDPKVFLAGEWQSERIFEVDVFSLAFVTDGVEIVFLHIEDQDIFVHHFYVSFRNGMV